MGFYYQAETLTCMYGKVFTQSFFIQQIVLFYVCEDVASLNNMKQCILLKETIT
jgi:hypothetical protein